EDDDRLERPSRRRSRRRDSGGYFAPHRGGLIMSLGIISLALILIEVFGYFLSPLVGAPFALVGLVLGIVAWIMGGSDLKQMNSGTMDPTGRGMTMAGHICGIIGTILRIAEMICSCVVLIVALIFGLAIFGAVLGAASSFPTGPAGPPPNPPPPR